MANWMENWMGRTHPMTLKEESLLGGALKTTSMDIGGVLFYFYLSFIYAYIFIFFLLSFIDENIRFKCWILRFNFFLFPFYLNIFVWFCFLFRLHALLLGYLVLFGLFQFGLHVISLFGLCSN